MNTLQGSKVDFLTTRNLDFHQRQIKNAAPSVDQFDYVIRKELDALQTQVNVLGSSGVSGSVNVTARSQTLSAASTTITQSAPAADGLLLFIQLVQDGTGGRQITWGGTFSSNTPNQIDTTASTNALFQFVSLGGSWLFVSAAL